jgi:hypothetical protein
MSDPTTAALSETREALHRVAEHVLSAVLKTETGHISLEQAPGGFCTPALPDGRVVAVDGSQIVVRTGAHWSRAPLTTVRAAAELAGISPGFPWKRHPPATPLEPDEPLQIDVGVAGVLADWFALGQEALDAFVARFPEDSPTRPVIYPEHFDLAISAAEVNYGFSPGDAEIPAPYVYIGPHEGPITDDGFWNAPFGACRRSSDVGSALAALDFLTDGRERVRAHRQSV